MRSRRIELVGGALGGALGLALLGIWLFAPGTTDCFGQTSVHCVPQSQVQLHGLASLLLPPITVFGGLSLGTALFAVWHSLARSLPALVLLWVCTALLWVISVETLLFQLSRGFVIGSPGFGVVFVPHLLALVASIAGTVAAWQRVPAHV